MEKLRELSVQEMQEISGGNPAYKIGYAIGKTLKDILLGRAIFDLFL